MKSFFPLCVSLFSFFGPLALGEKICAPVSYFDSSKTSIILNSNEGSLSNCDKSLLIPLNPAVETMVGKTAGTSSKACYSGHTGIFITNGGSERWCEFFAFEATTN